MDSKWKTLILVVILLLLLACIWWFFLKPDPPPPPTPTATDVPTTEQATFTPTFTRMVVTHTLEEKTPTPSKTATKVIPTIETKTPEPDIVTICTGYSEGYAHWRKGAGLNYLPFWWYDEVGHPVGGWLPEGTELIFVKEVNPYENVYWTEVLYEGRPGFTWSELICQ